LFGQIIRGTTNITEPLIGGFVKLFKLNSEQAAYFRVLVRFNQAKGHLEKKELFLAMLEMNSTSLKTLDASQYEFYSQWYYSALRALISICPVKDDYKKLAKMLHPSITATQARKGIELLLRLDLIQYDSDGFLCVTDRFITTGEQIRDIAVSEFQQQTTALAREAITALPRTMRCVSTLTLSLSGKSYARIEEKLKHFRAELMEIARAEQQPDRVVHCNFIVFPMSRPTVTEGPDA
jgi:uncharacterized protein (TIGR02147 family)